MCSVMVLYVTDIKFVQPKVSAKTYNMQKKSKLHFLHFHYICQRRSNFSIKNISHANFFVTEYKMRIICCHNFFY